MTRGDDRILEFLYNEGNKPIISTPAVISVNTNYSGDYIRKRVQRLRDAELIEYHNEDRAMFQITDRGIDYLNGELELDDFEYEA